MTPRLNPDVNGYWMCDIGRFDYRWIEGETRIRRALLRKGDRQEPVAWHDAEAALREGIQSAAGHPGSVRFLASAHASSEEFFVLRQLVEGIGPEGTKAVTVAWARSEKPQPEGAKFKVHVTDAPNVNGARDMGFAVGQGNDGPPDIVELRAAVESGRVKVLYVLAPGPEGAAGEVSWIIDARRSGSLPLLIVQGPVMNDLVRAADIVLPGAAFVEKDGIYTNADGLVQASSRAFGPPGEAREDWHVLVGVARALGLTLPFESSNDVRRAIAAKAAAGSPYAEADNLVFSRPVAARHWLQASNPSERWKWDFMYQDLPPVKGHNVQTEGMVQGTPYIPLKPVE
jgi:NADH-quinone oxidoreductase subunit G